MRRGRRWRRRLLVLGQPERLVVLGGDRPGGLVEQPARLALAAAGHEPQGQHPRPVLRPPAVPDVLPDVDSARGQPLLDPGAQRRRRHVGAAPAQRHGTAQLGDVRALGQHGAFVAADPVERPTAAARRPPRHSRRPGSGPGPRAAQVAGHLDLQLARGGPGRGGPRRAGTRRRSAGTARRRVRTAAGARRPRGRRPAAGHACSGSSVLRLRPTLPPKPGPVGKARPSRGRFAGRRRDAVVRPSTRAEPRPVRRGPAAQLRRPGRPGRRAALPGERHPWPGHPARAPARGRRALRRGRRPEPDQRPEPRPAARLARRAGLPRAEPAGRLGQPQLVAVRRRRPARAARRRCPAGRRRHHQRLLVVLLLPSVPRGPRPARC